MTTFKILALDISASPGVALIEIKGDKPRLQSVDHLETDSKLTDAQRYAVIESWLTQFIYDNKANPNAIVREKFIKGGSKRATQLVFGAWASVDRALDTFDLKVDDKDEIVASRVKKYIGGKGGASKNEVADGVIRYLGEEVRAQIYTDKGRLLDDRADAIAIGLAWAVEKGMVSE